MSINVLVTGANGQLAKTLQKLYKNNEDHIAFTFVTKNELDITESKQVQNYFSNNTFDYCINCAAYTNVEQAEKTPEIAFKVNAEAVKNLAETCKKTNTILIHISTDYVFDGENDKPYSTEDIPHPINEYGKSKLLGEQYIQETLKQHFIIRTSWIYSNFGKNFLKTVVENINNKIQLKIIDTQKGSPTSTYNLANFIFFLINNNVKSYGVYHFTDNDTVSWFEFAKAIVSSLDVTKGNLIVSTSESTSKTKRPKYSVLDNTKRLKIYNKEVLLNNSIKEIISLL